tara:strand:- start:5 stop:691 length:687 start_codon:yes stop_codon:yes gene_type:complete
MNDINLKSNNSDIEKNIDIKTTLNSIKDTPINNLTKISSPVESNNSFSFKSIIINFFLILLTLIILAIVIYCIYYYLDLDNLGDFFRKIYNKILKFFKNFNKQNDKENNDKENNDKENEITNDNDNDKKNLSDLSNNLVNSNYKDENKNKEENNILKKSINSAIKKSQELKDNIDLPDAIETTLQKSGYCFIGKLNDVRYCSEVSAKNKCLSGEIFPSMDLCINPNIK